MVRTSRQKAFLIGLLASLSATLAIGETLSAKEAKDHIGETATVCGTVASTKYEKAARGSPTYLDFDEPYPNQVFAIVIWGKDRSKFGEPEKSYAGKRICVNGVITSHRGKPEIVAKDPAQLKTQ